MKNWSFTFLKKHLFSWSLNVWCVCVNSERWNETKTAFGWSMLTLFLNILQIVSAYLSPRHPGSRPELHALPAHCRADPAQTQPPAQGPAALRQAHGVAEEHPEGEVRGPVQGQCSVTKHPKGAVQHVEKYNTLYQILTEYKMRGPMWDLGDWLLW